MTLLASHDVHGADLGKAKIPAFGPGSSHSFPMLTPESHAGVRVRLPGRLTHIGMPVADARLFVPFGFPEGRLLGRETAFCG